MVASTLTVSGSVLMLHCMVFPVTGRTLSPFIVAEARRCQSPPTDTRPIVAEARRCQSPPTDTRPIVAEARRCQSPHTDTRPMVAEARSSRGMGHCTFGASGPESLAHDFLANLYSFSFAIMFKLLRSLKQ